MERQRGTEALPDASQEAVFVAIRGVGATEAQYVAEMHESDDHDPGFVIVGGGVEVHDFEEALTCLRDQRLIADDNLEYGDFSAEDRRMYRARRRGLDTLIGRIVDLRP